MSFKSQIVALRYKQNFEQVFSDTHEGKHALVF